MDIEWFPWEMEICLQGPIYGSFEEKKLEMQILVDSRDQHAYNLSVGESHKLSGTKFIAILWGQNF